jgi:hypothetical protein
MPSVPSSSSEAGIPTALTLVMSRVPWHSPWGPDKPASLPSVERFPADPRPRTLHRS